MKKTKKLLACLIAAATMFTMGSTAFAADAGNKAQAPVDGKVQFTKEYKLIGDGESPAEIFNFTIENAGVTDAAEKVNVANMPKPTVGTVSYDKKGATTNGNKKTVDVTLPDYTSVGVYTYTINETPGTTAGVDYDTVPVTMKVTVVNGEIEGTFKVESVSFTKNDTKLAREEAAFNNTYTANKLEVSKTVTGNLGDKSKYFDFTITLAGKDDKTTYNANGYTVSGDSYAENPTSIKVGESKTFKLKHGDTITIENLPKDVTYTVTETAVDKYTTKVNGTESNEASGKTTSDKATQAFVNTKGGEIDTGVNLTTLPYILVFAGVIVIAGAAFITRRRKFED